MIDSIDTHTKSPILTTSINQLYKGDIMRYYELVGTIEGDQEVLFGSYIESEVEEEKECEQATLRLQGYRGLKVVSREVQETPDSEVYGETQITYFDSAEGITITHKRAIKELRDNGVIDITEFYADLGKQETYEAQAVLAWLGY